MRIPSFFAATRGGRWTAVFMLAAIVEVFGAAGCSAPPAFDYHALGLLPAQEKLAEFSLGKFAVPIPMVTHDDVEQARRHNRFQFDFELFALVRPHQAAEVASGWERRQGEIRDRVIRACRNASVGDFQEPGFGTLKSNLADVVQTYFSDAEIRQVLIVDVVSEQL